MKVTQEELVDLFVKMGFKNATKWTLTVLEGKLAKIQSLMDDDVTLEDKASARLLKNIVKAQKANEEVTIVVDKTPEVAAAKKAGVANAGRAAAGKKKPVAVEEEEDEDEDESDEDEPDEEGDEDKSSEEDDEDSSDEDEDDEDEDVDNDDETEKPVKKGKQPVKKTATATKEKPVKKTAASVNGKAKPEAKKTKGTFPRGEGVIAFIIEMLKGASKKSPISKAEMLKRLHKKFPHKEESALKGTLNTQVPSHLRKKKGLNIQKNENGYYIAKGEPVVAEKPAVKKPVAAKAGSGKKGKGKSEEE